MVTDGMVLRAQAASGLLLLAVLAAGCSSSPTGGDAATDNATPRQILDDTIAVYKNASAYEDRVRVQLKYEVEGQPFDEGTELIFTLVRKSKSFRFELKRPKTHLLAVCDGQHVEARVGQTDTDDFDHQLVERPAPSEITVRSIYSATEYLPRAADVARSGPPQMASFLEGTHISLDDLPLALLLADKPLAHLAADDSKLTRKLDQKLDGRDCYRLAFTTEAGDYVYWIEKKTHLIQRIELPTTKLAAELVMPLPSTLPSSAPASDPDAPSSVKNISFWVDVQNPTIRPDLEVLTPPPVAASTKVRYFVYPPAPLPSKLFGRKLGAFAFTDLAGNEVNQSAFAGKISVLLWWNNQPASKQAFTQVDAIYRQVKNDQRFQFFAVCAEPGVLNNGHIAAIVQNWKADKTKPDVVPVLRDIKAAGRDVFQINEAPTCIVLDAGGFVQLVEVGANPLLARELPMVLGRLARGDDLAAELIKSQADEQAEYHKQLAIAQGEPAGGTIVLDDSVPAATAPRQMRLTMKWKRDLKNAGNILPLEGPLGTPSVLVLAAGRQVVPVSELGEPGTPIDLGLPEGEIATLVRRGRFANGEPFFAVAGKRGPAVHFYKSDWKPWFSYPPNGQPHDGVQDVLLADLGKGVGEQESQIYVGFWGEVGVHAVGFDGATLWRNRVLTPVLSLASFTVPNEGRLMLATGNRGLILPINKGGKEGKAYQVGDKQIHLITAGRFPAPRASGYLGCSYLADGGLLLVALDDGLREAWAYPLPTGTYQTPIELLQSGRLLDDAGAGQWVVAGPDGSVHILSDDGDFVDNFRTGRQLTGIAASGKLLLLASPEGVEAWELTRVAK